MTHEANDMLRAEADALLRSGLSDALSRYGEVHPVGSYALGLMAWRDLDLHVVRETADPDPVLCRWRTDRVDPQAASDALP